MKANGDKSSSRDRLNKFLDNIFPLKNDTQGNDAPIGKSRWVMWSLNNDGCEKKPAFRQMEKPESKLFNRLFDRLDPSAGKARHAARKEIINLLQANGLEVTANIKRHLPDTRKLGNINALGQSIRCAIEEKKASSEKEIEKKFKETFESKIQNKAFDELSKKENIFSEDENILKDIESYLEDEMHEPVKKLADSIFKSISDSRKKYNVDNTNPEYGSERSIRADADSAGLQGAQKTFNEEFFQLTTGEKFKSLSSKLSAVVDEALKNNEAANNSITQDDINQLKEKINHSLLISSCMKLLDEELAKKPIIGAISSQDLLSSKEKS